MPLHWQGGKMNTIHHLSESELSDYLLHLKGYERVKQRTRYHFEQLVIKEGYQFAFNYQYVTSQLKASLICPVGHLYDVSPNNFRSSNNKKGARCSKCSKQCKEQARNKFEALVESEGYRFAEGYDYQGSLQKVTLICPVGHLYNVMPNNFKGTKKQKGARCAKCSGKCTEQAQLAFEALVIQEGYRFAEYYKYKGIKRKAELICPKGHLYKVTPASFKGTKVRKGSRCKYRNRVVEAVCTSFALEAILKKQGITSKNTAC